MELPDPLYTQRLALADSLAARMALGDPLLPAADAAPAAPEAHDLRQYPENSGPSTAEDSDPGPRSRDDAPGHRAPSVPDSAPRHLADADVALAPERQADGGAGASPLPQWAAEEGPLAVGPWSSALENLRAAEESRRALEEALVGPSAVFVDEEALRSIAGNAAVAQQLKAQQRRVEALQRELSAAVSAASHAKAALRRSEQARAALQDRLAQVEKELEATSGVFEVYTSELRARQREVEKRCEEVRVLQAIVRKLSDGREGKAEP